MQKATDRWPTWIGQWRVIPNTLEGMHDFLPKLLGIDATLFDPDGIAPAMTNSAVHQYAALPGATPGGLQIPGVQLTILRRKLSRTSLTVPCIAAELGRIEKNKGNTALYSAAMVLGPRLEPVTTTTKDDWIDEWGQRYMPFHPFVPDGGGGYKPSAATKLSNYPFIRLDRPQYVPVPNIFQPAFGVSALVMLNMEKSSGVSYGVSVRTDPGTLINPPSCVGYQFRPLSLFYAISAAYSFYNNVERESMAVHAPGLHHLPSDDDRFKHAIVHYMYWIQSQVAATSNAQTTRGDTFLDMTRFFIMALGDALAGSIQGPLGGVGAPTKSPARIYNSIVELRDLCKFWDVDGGELDTPLDAGDDLEAAMTQVVDMLVPIALRWQLATDATASYFDGADLEQADSKGIDAGLQVLVSNYFRFTPAGAPDFDDPATRSLSQLLQLLRECVQATQFVDMLTFQNATADLSSVGPVTLTPPGEQPAEQPRAEPEEQDDAAAPTSTPGTEWTPKPEPKVKEEAIDRDEEEPPTRHHQAASAGSTRPEQPTGTVPPMAAPAGSLHVESTAFQQMLDRAVEKGIATANKRRSRLLAAGVAPAAQTLRGEFLAMKQKVMATNGGLAQAGMDLVEGLARIAESAGHVRASAADPEDRKLMGQIRSGALGLIKRIRTAALREKHMPDMPKGTYGTMWQPHFVKPDANTRKLYGASAKTANAQQLANREFDYYTGAGNYMQGNGAYLGRWLGQQVGKIPRVGKFLQAPATKFLSDTEDALVHKGIDMARRYVSGDGAYDDADDVETNDYMAQVRAEDDAADHQRRVRSGQLYVPHDPDARRQANQIVGGNHAAHAKMPPQMWTAADETGDLLFSHTEYLGDIVGNGGTFDMNRIIYINPGLKDSFPVLARIASLFAEYRFERLIFIYKTLVTSGNGVAAGSVEMATRYNPDASDYTTKAQMKDADYSVGGKVDDEIVCGIECKQERNAVDGRLYIRTTPLGEYSSLHTYDMAKVEIALNNVPKDLLVGELYVAYTCRLCKMTNTTDMEPLPLNNGFSLSLVPVVDPQRWEYVTYGWIGTRSLQNNIWINGGIEDRGQIMNPQTFPLPTWQTTTGNSANWLPGGPELSGRGIVTIDAGEEQANGVGDSMMVETYNMHSSIQFAMRVYQGGDPTAAPFLRWQYNAAPQGRYLYAMIVHLSDTTAGAPSTPLCSVVAQIFSGPARFTGNGGKYLTVKMQPIQIAQFPIASRDNVNKCTYIAAFTVDTLGAQPAPCVLQVSLTDVYNASILYCASVSYKFVRIA